MEAVTGIPALGDILGSIDPVVYVYYWDPVTDKQGFSEIGGACEDFFCGMKQTEVVKGKFLFQDFVHPDDLRFWRPTNAYCHEEGADFTFEMRMKTVSGEYRWCRAHARYVGRKEDGMEYWYGVVDDISDLKETCEELERCRSVLLVLEEFLNVAMDFYFIVNQDLRVFSCGSINDEGRVKTRYFLDDFIADLEDKSKILGCIRQKSMLPVKMVQINIRLPGRLDESFKVYAIHLPTPPFENRILVGLERVHRYERAPRSTIDGGGINELADLELEADMESIMGYLFAVSRTKSSLQAAWTAHDVAGCFRLLDDDLASVESSGEGFIFSQVWLRFLGWALCQQTWPDEEKHVKLQKAMEMLRRWEKDGRMMRVEYVHESLFFLVLGAVRGVRRPNGVDQPIHTLFFEAIRLLRLRYCRLEVLLLHFQMGIRVANMETLKEGARWFNMAAGLSCAPSSFLVQLRGLALYNLAFCCGHSPETISRLGHFVAENPAVEFDPRISKLLCAF
jgi:PAS domain S-box-containing protein